MTCRRSETNMYDALYKTARNMPGGVEQLAGWLSLSVQGLYSKLRREVNTHHISYEESALIQERAAACHQSDAYDSLHSYAWRLGHVAIKLPDIGSSPAHGQILQLLCHTFKAEGDVAQAIERALANDQRINTEELDTIDKTMMDAITSLLVLRQMCHDKHDHDNRSSVR